MGLRVRIDDRAVTLPTCWAEATLEHVATATTCPTLGDLLTAMLGIDPVPHTSDIALSVMADAVLFLTEPPPLPPITCPVDVPQMSWENWNEANSALNAANPQLLAAPEVVRVYTGRTDWPLLDLLAHWSHIIEQMDAHIERFADLFNQTPDENELAAGIDRIQKFGWFGTLDALAGGDPLKYDPLLLTPVITVHTKLLLDMVKGDYLRNLKQFNEISAGR
jgi:hypothetical protein